MKKQIFFSLMALIVLSLSISNFLFKHIFSFSLLGFVPCLGVATVFCCLGLLQRKSKRNLIFSITTCALWLLYIVLQGIVILLKENVTMLYAGPLVIVLILHIITTVCFSIYSIFSKREHFLFTLSLLFFLFSYVILLTAEDFALCLPIFLISNSLSLLLAVFAFWQRRKGISTYIPMIQCAIGMISYIALFLVGFSFSLPSIFLILLNVSNFSFFSIDGVLKSIRRCRKKQGQIA